MVRDLFQIPGKVQIDIQGRILKITLNRDHVYLKIVNVQRVVVWGIAIQAYLLIAPVIYAN
jgi:hypothetical protein